MQEKPKKKKKLIEGVDFYYNERGFMVLTAKYHLENGRCCGNECVNCPYDHVNVRGKREEGEGLPAGRQGQGRREEGVGEQPITHNP